jgi:hypothetical protein
MVGSRRRKRRERPRPRVGERRALREPAGRGDAGGRAPGLPQRVERLRQPPAPAPAAEAAEGAGAGSGGAAALPAGRGAVAPGGVPCGALTRPGRGGENGAQQNQAAKHGKKY